MRKVALSQHSFMKDQNIFNQGNKRENQPWQNKKERFSAQEISLTNTTKDPKFYFLLFEGHWKYIGPRSRFQDMLVVSSGLIYKFHWRVCCSALCKWLIYGG